MGDTGNELLPKNTGETPTLPPRGTDSGTVACQACLNLASHPELQVIIDAWPELPPAVQAGIVAMVEAST